MNATILNIVHPPFCILSCAARFGSLFEIKNFSSPGIWWFIPLLLLNAAKSCSFNAIHLAFFIMN